MRLSPKKNGKGYITSYTLNIGSKEARELKFVDEKGDCKELEKIINSKKSELYIKIKK